MSFFDSYEHIDKNLIYIPENIPITETEEKFEEIFAEGCTCIEQCQPEHCSCIVKYGLNYVRGEIGLVVDFEQNSAGIYECNTNCKCAASCGNRLVQFGPKPGLKIRNTGEKGFGLFTTADRIEKGGFICEYAGELITALEAQKRYQFNLEQNRMNFILTVREYYGRRFDTWIIDPNLFGNIGRYANHSCWPNCVLIPVRVHGPVPKLCIFARWTIAANTELTFDYGDGLENSGGHALTQCLCGEETCRKWMPYNQEL